MQNIRTYFPNLTPLQIKQFEELKYLYQDWNNKINVISRKDIDNLYLHHVLHSLAIAKIIQFKSNTSIIDVGTGGGFPGIPLAILFPDCQFHLIDAIAKKVTVAREVAQSIKLQNVRCEQVRIEKVKHKYDFIVSRAVTNFEKFYKLSKHCISNVSKNDMQNGILYLKGGDFADEIININNKITIYNISDFFNEDFFETKKIIHCKY